MRIISGSAKGRRLFFPRSLKVRPATDKVKEAVYNILGNVEGFVVADLFAGSGSMGLEALSRGARKVVFMEQLPLAIKILSRNLSECGFKEKSVVVKGKIPNQLARLSFGAPYDIIFVDPPYDNDLIDVTLRDILKHKLIDATSLIIIEHSPREIPQCEGYEVVDHRKYGQTFILFAKLKDQK